MGSRVSDASGHHVTGPYDLTGGGRDVYEPVVPCPTRQPVGGAVLATLALGDQHLDLAALERLVLLPGDLVDHLDEPLVAFLHDRVRQLLVHRGSGSPGPQVQEREGTGEPASFTTANVSSKSASVSPGKPTMMSVVIAASGIAARTRSRIEVAVAPVGLHRLEYVVRPRLERHVQAAA